MTIIAKFPGTCRKCGHAIKAGQEINWTKGEGSEHVTCPAPAAKPATAQTQAAPQGIVKVFTSRDRGAISNGYTFKTKDGQILTVIHVASRWINQNEVDDQDDFRQGGDPFYECRATCREATPEEAAPIIEKARVQAVRATARKRLDEIVERIRTAANHVTNMTARYPVVEGVESISMKLDTIHRIEVSGSGIWFHQSTYDDSYAWRIDYDETTAVEIRTLADAIRQ